MQSANDPNSDPLRTELDALLDAGLARRGTPAPLEAGSGPLLEELDSLLAGRRTAPPLPLAERDPAIPSEAFLWLALAPVWTVSAAEAARLPSGGLKPGELLERLADRGLLATGMVRPRTDLKKVLHPGSKPPSPSEGQRTYRMSQVGRAAVLRPLLANGNRRFEIQRALHQVGAALKQAEKAGAVVLPECRRWSALAEMGTSKTARAFAEQFDAALAANDSAEALYWMEAARTLAGLLERLEDLSLTLELERCSRRLDLQRRRENDARHLQHFKERTEQGQAVEALLDGSAERWALHLLGSGGMGKTMLIRHLAATLTGAPRWVALARLDFDHLNADFPRRAPGLLLTHLSQELRAYDPNSSGKAVECFQQCEAAFSELHRELSEAHGTGLEAIRQPLFVEGFRWFVDGLRALDRPVLLILDTCEELTKPRADGTVPDSLEVTFRILQALRDGPNVLLDESAPPDPRAGFPSLRVIFSGRRPLASTGAGWKGAWAPKSDGIPSPFMRLPVRPFLRLHEIRGFPQSEARTYLQTELGLTGALAEAVITASSRNQTPAAEITWVDASDAGVPEEPRCNPYELRLYADWARSEPPPEASTLAAADSDQYLETRILGRLNCAPLERVLPALVRAGDFHEGLLRVLLEPEEDLAVVFDELLQQEWIEHRVHSFAEGDGGRLILSVSGDLRRRLEGYYDRKGGDGAVLEAAGYYLRTATLAEPLGRLEPTAFRAALRVLQRAPFTPRDAAEWWEELHQRLISERDPTWALGVTSTLLEAGGGADAREHGESSLRPAVLALHAGAVLRTGAPAERLQIWEEVFLKASRYPLPQVAESLRLRAILGRVAASYPPADPPRPEHLEALVVLLESGVHYIPGNELHVSALVAAVEALLERLELPEHERGMPLAVQRPVPADRPVDQTRSRSPAGPSWVDLLHQSIDWMLQHLPQYEVSCFLPPLLCSFRARLHRCQGDQDQAEQWFECSRCGDLPAEPGFAAGFLDWKPPAELPARLRLEIARGMEGSPRLLELVGDWPALNDNVDSDRLQSARLRAAWEAGSERMSQVALPDLERAVALDPLRIGPNSCGAHAAVPPLFTTAAECLAAAGDVDRALSTLREVVRDSDRFAAGVRSCSGEVLGQILHRWRLQPPDERRERELRAAVTEQYTYRPDTGSHWPAEELHKFVIRGPGRSLERLLAQSARLAADRAQSIGDALLREDKSAALEYFRFAHEQSEAGDALRVISLIAELLACGPSHRAPAAAAKLGVLELEWRTFLATESGARLGLPDWSALHTAAGASDTTALADLGTPAWRPWLSRLVLCLAHFRHRNAREVLEWIRQNAGHANTDDKDPLPADLREWGAKMGTVGDASARPDVRYLFGALGAVVLAIVILNRITHWAVNSTGLRTWIEAIFEAKQSASDDYMWVVWPIFAAIWVVGFGVMRTVRSPVLGSVVRSLLRLLVLGPYLLAALITVALHALYSQDPTGWFQPLYSPHAYDSTRLSLTVWILSCWVFTAWWLSDCFWFFRSRWVRKARLTLSAVIEPKPASSPEAGEVSGKSVELAARCEWPVLRLGWPLRGARTMTPEPMRLRFDDNGSYREQSTTQHAGGKVNPALGLLRRLCRQLRYRPLASSIEAGPGIHELPLEAAATHAIDGRLRDPREFPLRFYRSVSGRPLRPRAPLAQVEFGLWGKAAASPAALRGWDRLHRSVRFEIRNLDTDDLRVSTDAASTPPGQSMQVVHLFGTVHQVTGGLRFRPEIHQSGSAAQSEPFRSDDLTLAFAQAQVLILQAPSQSYDRTRRAVDRRQAGLARAFAAELHAQGIPVVLVLPPMEAERIAPLLKRLASWLTRRHIGFAALQEEMVQIQAELVRRLSKVPRGSSRADRDAAREAAWEVACDLCLYADPNWNGWTFTAAR